MDNRRDYDNIENEYVSDASTEMYSDSDSENNNNQNIDEAEFACGHDYEFYRTKEFQEKTVKISCDNCQDKAMTAGLVFNSSPGITYKVRKAKRNLEVTAVYTEECNICFANEANAVFILCGHRSVCFDCATRIKLESKKCPFCKQDIDFVIKTFTS